MKVPIEKSRSVIILAIALAVALAACLFIVGCGSVSRTQQQDSDAKAEVIETSAEDTGIEGEDEAREASEADEEQELAEQEGLQPSQSEQDQPDSEPSIEGSAEGEVSPEVKEFCDSYEALTDEYVSFMARLQDASESDYLMLLNDMYGYLDRLEEFETQADALEDTQLSIADDAYLAATLARVSQKLLSASISIL